MDLFVGRATVNLKDGIVHNRLICDKKMKGTKRGKYNVNAARKAMDEVDFMRCKVFKDESIHLDGEEYLDLLHGGRIPVKYKDLFMYVKLGKAPEDWVRCLDGCKILSVVKREQAKQARHLIIYHK